MSEISSGLVAVAWIAPDEDRFRVRICEDRPTDAPLWSPMCWVSDAEAIIAQKDAEILDQCRINGIGAERELHLLAQVAAKDAEIERLDGECNRLAKAASKNYRDNGLPINEEFYKQAEMIEKQSAALKLAREALFDMQDSYAAVHGWKDSFVIAATTAIAAIDALGEVK